MQILLLAFMRSRIRYIDLIPSVGFKLFQSTIDVFEEPVMDQRT